MIEINLLPKELQGKRLELIDFSFLSVMGLFLGVIIICHLLLGLSINIKIKTLRRLEKTWQQILPDKESADRFKSELTTMRNRIDTIDSLIQGRMSWAMKLSDLNDAIISSVWLNRLWLEKKGILPEPEAKKSEEGKQARAEPEKIILKTLHLSGSVIATGGEETAAIGRFIRSLKNSQGFFADFREIESASIQRNRLKDVEVMDFELICYFK